MSIGSSIDRVLGAGSLTNTAQGFIPLKAGLNTAQFADDPELMFVNSLGIMGYDFNPRVSSTYSKAFSKIFGEDTESRLDLAGFNAAKKFDIERSQARNEQAAIFAQESDVYNAQMMRQSQDTENYINRLGEVNQRLGDIKSGFASASSKASSKREFQALSQQAMQGTNRYLAELERIKTPTVNEIDFRFTDPITGNKLDINTEFEDIYDPGVDAATAADMAVRNRFSEISTAKTKEASDYLSAQLGRPEDFYADSGKSEEQWLADLTRVIERDPTKRNPRTRTYAALLNQYNASKQIEEFAVEYGEASALADIGGYNDPISTESYYGEFDYDPSSLFFQQDTNAILRDYSSKTAQRLEIAGLSDEKQMRQEFQRRKDLAINERTQYDTQLQRNQAQAERIEAEKQQTRMLMEEQKREYAESMSSFSAPTSSGQSITFTDTRPQ